MYYRAHYPSRECGLQKHQRAIVSNLYIRFY
nr:MAG TPA: hypothetical protein [Caudoviricetes sp.]